MDLFTVVALSMLPASRSRVASAFKDIRHRLDLECDATLDRVLQACELDQNERAAAIEVARERASAALVAAKTACIEALSWNDPRYPALLSCIPDPPPVLWTRGDLGLSRPPHRGDRRIESRHAVRARRRLSARPGAVGSRRSSSPAVWRVGSIPPPTGVACPAAHRQLRCSGPAVDRVYPSQHAELASEISKKGLLISELGPGSGAAARALSAEEPYYLRDLARRRGRRSVREERVAHYRPMRPRAGSRRDGRAG